MKTTINEANKHGGQPGNANNLRHGLRSSRLPHDLKHINNAADGVRKQLEAECIAVHGEIDINQASVIWAACEHSKRNAVVYHYLRENAKREAAGTNGKATLTIPEKVAMQKESGNAADAVVKCIRLLELKLSPQDLQRVIAEIYQQPTGDPPAPLSEPSTENATPHTSEPTEVTEASP